MGEKRGRSREREEKRERVGETFLFSLSSKAARPETLRPKLPVWFIYCLS